LEYWKAGYDPKKFVGGCFLSDLTGLQSIFRPHRLSKRFYNDVCVKFQEFYV